MIKGKYNFYVSRDEQGTIEDFRHPGNKLDFLKVTLEDDTYSCNLKDYKIKKVSREDLEWSIDDEAQLEGWERFFNATAKEGPKFCFDETGNLVMIEDVKKR